MGTNGWEFEDENKLHVQLNKDLDKIFEADIKSIQFETKLVRNLTLAIFFISFVALMYLGISFPEILKTTLMVIGVLFFVVISVLAFLLFKSRKWFKKALENYVNGGEEEDKRYLSALNKINYNGGI
jgi:hypothetical protein